MPKHEPSVDDAPRRGWLSRERGLALALLAATAISFYVCYLLIQPFLPAIAWALALAVVLHPVHGWLEHRLGKENLAAALAVALVAVCIAVPAVFVADQMVREIGNTAQILDDPRWQRRWQAAVERHPSLERLTKTINREQLEEDLRRASQTMVSYLPSFVGGWIWAGMQLLIMFFALFFFFRDRRAALRTVRSIMPLSNTEMDRFMTRLSDTLYATIYGRIAMAALQGALGGLMFWWLGLPAPILWGVVMAAFSTIPNLGSFVVWVPAAVFLALEGSWIRALILTLWGSIVIAMVDNLLYPLMVGKKMRLHTLLVFFALLGGVVQFGMAGIILGPVVMAVTVALVDVWRARTSGGRTAEEGFHHDPPSARRAAG